MQTMHSCYTSIIKVDSYHIFQHIKWNPDAHEYHQHIAYLFSHGFYVWVR
jgi:hypothetical protein